MNKYSILIANICIISLNETKYDKHIMDFCAKYKCIIKARYDYRVFLGSRTGFYQCFFFLEGSSYIGRTSSYIALKRRVTALSLWYLPKYQHLKFATL